MKKIAILGGIVIALIAVIKIGGIFLDTSDKDSGESKVSTEETSTMTPTLATGSSKEPITIEIENGSGAESASQGLNPTETLAQAEPETTSSGASGGSNLKASTAATAASFSVTPMDEKTMYAIKSVNVRKSASTDSDILGGLAPGKEVKATGETGSGWIRISYNGGEAYVYKTYLSANKADVVAETTAAKKADSTTKKTSAAKETKAKSTKPAATTAAAPAPAQAPADETIAPFPGN